MPNNLDKEEKPTQVKSYNWHSHHGVAAAVVIVIVGLILLAGAFAAGAHARRWDSRPALMGQKRVIGARGFGSRFGGGTFNTTDQVSGVVTAVNGSTFTVASNGATKDVITNSSTQYEGGDSVKVNDSVLVQGSTSNNQFTADTVVINP